MTAPGKHATRVAFFDLVGTVVLRDGHGRFVPRQDVIELIPAEGPSGVLCNLPRGLGLRDATRILEEAGAVGLFSSDLMVVASALPCPLPDARAFAVAAALARASVNECRFVSADAGSCTAADEAGMEAVYVPVNDSLASPPEPGLFADISEPMPQLYAGEVDEDIGPTFVLTGRVVTMAGRGEVHDDAQLVISRGRITALVPAGSELPGEYESAPRLDTGGTIYPGLIDLHNHFVYDVLPLWKIPRCYSNRSQWPKAADYASDVQLPVRALAERPSTAQAIVRYVEAKALAGGTTTGQGMRTRVYGGSRLFHGAMRNVEETNDPRLPEAGTLVPSLYVSPERVQAFKAALAARTAYFYHLAEGRDDAARRTYSDLVDNDLLSRSLVGIHCLGLHPADLYEFAGAGGKCVWSPFSNLLLYGRTLDLSALRASGIRFSIGCDWTPTGSKNLLQELKVARWVVESQSADLTTEDLARAVTCDAAAVVGWEGRVGMLAVGAFGDLLVLRGRQGDPFDQLVSATENDIALVLVHGVARYGDWELLARLHTEPDRPPERWSVASADKAFNLQTPDSDLSGVTVASARETLLDAMSDLVAFRESSAEQEATLQAMGLDAPSFVLELDNEYVPSPDDALAAPPEPELAADWSRIAASVELDTVEVGGGDYWERIDAQRNIDDSLKETLRTAYDR
jgi:5-methylthioadenosine/S-adenosylhomocysteine deaminase